MTNYNLKLDDVNWRIDNLYTTTIGNETNYVVYVDWSCIGDATIDGVKYTAVCSNTAILSTDNVDNFIPYDQLTQEKVLEWVVASLGEVGVSNVLANIQGQLQNFAYPPTPIQHTPNPWAGNKAP